MSTDQFLASLEDRLSRVENKLDAVLEAKAVEAGQRNVWRWFATIAAAVIGSLITTFFTKGKP